MYDVLFLWHTRTKQLESNNKMKWWTVWKKNKHEHYYHFKKLDTRTISLKKLSRYLWKRILDCLYQPKLMANLAN